MIDLICSFSYCQQELGKTWEDIQNENEEEEEDKTDNSAGEEWVEIHCSLIMILASDTGPN